MDIEKEIFKRTKLDIDTLIPYGFVKKKNNYQYSKKFMNSFRADIVISEEGEVTGKVYDMDAEEEYINLRIDYQIGEFVNRVQEEYKNILKDIREHCFHKNYFITEQANRITNKVIAKYHNEPEFAWVKFPGYGIFRNPNNEKWYGLIMNIDKSKIDKGSSGEIEVINVKLDEEEIPSLLNKKGFYPSYHMNKRNWVTITLDDTLSDEEVMKYVSISHKYTETPKEWIVPANPKYYDIINYFKDKSVIDWKQSNNMKVGDIVYLYVAIPYSAILYKCEVIETNIPCEYKDKNVSMNRVMNMKLLKRYEENQYTLSKLNEYGIKAIRGPRSVPEKLKKELKKEKI